MSEKHILFTVTGDDYTLAHAKYDIEVLYQQFIHNNAHKSDPRWLELFLYCLVSQSIQLTVKLDYLQPTPYYLRTLLESSLNVLEPDLSAYDPQKIEFMRQTYQKYIQNLLSGVASLQKDVSVHTFFPQSNFDMVVFFVLYAQSFRTPEEWKNRNMLDLWKAFKVLAQNWDSDDVTLNWNGIASVFRNAIGGETKID